MEESSGHKGFESADGFIHLSHSIINSPKVCSFRRSAITMLLQGGAIDQAWIRRLAAQHVLNQTRSSTRIEQCACALST